MGRDAYGAHQQGAAAAAAGRVRQYELAVQERRARLLWATADELEPPEGCGGRVAQEGLQPDGRAAGLQAGACGAGGRAPSGAESGAAGGARGAEEDAALMTMRQLVALLVQADVRPPDQDEG